MNLQSKAVQAIHDAVRKQSGDIERQTVQACAAPLRFIERPAAKCARIYQCLRQP
jgi:hypothetical protein